jgi:vacuolar-type H+-ATPase subunit F/Vma7
MGRLIVLTTPELAAGYRLAGAATRAIESVADAADTVHELLAAGGEGDVIAVHEPFFNALDAPLRRRIDSLVSPLVVALPGGEGAHAEAERRAQHLRVLWEAVGYEITFEPGDDPS